MKFEKARARGVGRLRKCKKMSNVNSGEETRPNSRPNLFQIFLSKVSQPRVISFVKWIVIPGVSVGVCVLVGVGVYYYVSHQNKLHASLKSSIETLKTKIETDNARNVTKLMAIIKRQNHIIHLKNLTFLRFFKSNGVLKEEQEKIGELIKLNTMSFEQLSRSIKLGPSSTLK